MKKPTREQIKAALEEPNGAARLTEPGTDQRALCIEAMSLFIDEGEGSALLARLSGSKALLGLMKTNPDLLRAVLEALKSDKPKLRRNAARLAGALGGGDASAAALIEALDRETQLFVRPSLILALGAVGGSIANERLKAHTVPDAADEAEEKHRRDEREALKTALASLSKHEKHEFCGLDREYEIELLAPDRLGHVLKDELDELGFKVYDLRSGSVKVTTDDYAALFNARCFTEALFPIAKGIDDNVNTVAAKAKPFMLRFMRAVHAGEPPFRYRIQINGGSADSAEYKKRLRGLIDCDELINSPSDYEVELRLEAPGPASRLYLKLLTVADTRFAYRRTVVSAGVNPATAAAVLRLAGEYMTVNARVLDPCCGSGTMLFERGLLSPCASLTGVDISHKTIDCARENAAAACGLYGIKQAKFICNDILRFESTRPYDELICNLPFGNRVGNHASCEKLYSGLLDRLPRLIRPGGTALLYTMEFTMLKRLIRERPFIELLRQERTESGGLTPMIFIIRLREQADKKGERI